MSIDKENVFRSLADKPLFARKQWHCAFGIHTWLPWNEPKAVKRGVYEFVEQYRSCGHCNKSQRQQLLKQIA